MTRPYKKRHIHDRFWSKVDANGPVLYADLGPCWVWVAARDRKGYGRFGIEGRSSSLLAHRISWELEHGVEPTMQIMHLCDNPSCVRPSHLESGTNADNVADMVRKNRQSRGRRHGESIRRRVPRGERHHFARLNADIVRKVRAMAASGLGPTRISRSLALPRGPVSDVLRRATWGHVK